MAIKAIIIVALVLTACQGPRQATWEQTLTITNPHTRESVNFEYILFTNTAQKRQGLSGYTDLASNQGALFYLNSGDSAFWMKDMNFPLDIIFIDEDMKVIKLELNLPPCLESERCPRYNVPKNARWALEVPAGTAETHSISTGDSLSL